jgi:hypothetical protein
MGIRENIQIFHAIDIDRYLDILIRKYRSEKHPRQDGAYLIDGLPFYKPLPAEGYVFILGFNMAPLSYVLIQALADYPELAPGDTRVLWTQEQDLVMDTLVDNFDI